MKFIKLLRSDKDTNINNTTIYLNPAHILYLVDRCEQTPFTNINREYTDIHLTTGAIISVWESSIKIQQELN